jgi:uncharacterized Zn finger protein
MSVTYTRDQVATWFGKHTVAKAMGYLRKVSDLNWDGRTLRGTVQGSEFIPYRTEVYFSGSSRPRVERAECSCPVGYRCKHAAALLLATLQEPPQGAAAIRPEMLRWLEHFREEVTRAGRKPSSTKSKTTHTLLYAFHAGRNDAPCGVSTRHA